MIKQILNLSVLGLAITLPVAFATPVAPLGVGQSGLVVTSDSMPSGTAVANTGMAAFNGVNTMNVTVFSGQYESEVFRDSTTGNLDFFYYVSNDSTSRDTIARISAGDFTGFTTSVGYVSGTTQPTSADRYTADTVGFNVDLAPSANTWLEIQTNAKYYTIGTLNIQDDGQAQVAAFAPAVPEPVSMSLLGGGLVGLGLMRWRRSAKK